MVTEVVMKETQKGYEDDGDNSVMTGMREIEEEGEGRR